MCSLNNGLISKLQFTLTQPTLPSGTPGVGSNELLHDTKAGRSESKIMQLRLLEIESKPALLDISYNILPDIYSSANS
jgi:hypothetical protein